jgi:hypothetical protein
MLGADESVLAGAHQPGGGTVVGAQRSALELLGDEDVIRERVLDRHERAVAVEAAESEVRHGLARRKGRLDDLAIEGREPHSLPAHASRRPPRHAVEVGGLLPALQRREPRQRHGEGLRHRTPDLDRRVGGDLRRGMVEMRPEAREAVDTALARRKRRTVCGHRGAAGRVAHTRIIHTCVNVCMS